ncbi:MAG: aspartate kinase [Chloroflexota bacterium]
MSVVIQKYGGSSLADALKIKNVAHRIIKARERGDRVVVVASAMGDTTDELIKLAHRITDQPDKREMDSLLSTGELVSCALLAIALKSMGYPAVSLSGAQAGIITEKTHGAARILRVDPARMQRELEAGHIVIVAGFQGITDEATDVTTLGRGGSNTTAVAVAAALGARVCEMYTDVEGVFSADPRIVPEAVKLKEIGFEEMLELATYGSNVLHNRAVELAELYNIPIMVASSFVEAPGTLIHGGIPMEVRNKVRGIAQDLNVAQITVVGVPDKPGVAAALFEPLAEAGVSVDTIVQTASIGRAAELTFTVAKNDMKRAMDIIEPVAKSLGAKRVTADASMAKVSVVGTGMQNTPGYAAKMFRVLSEKGINIELITTSEIRITVVIAADRVNEAVRALHRGFELEKA